MSMTSSPEQTTLGHSVGSDAFVHQIAAHARKQAELAEQASGGEAGGHVAALHNFADFLTTRGPRDQRIFALWKMAMYSPPTPTCPVRIRPLSSESSGPALRHRFQSRP